MANYLDTTGLTYFWGKIKAYISGLGFYTKPSTGIPASDIESGVIPAAQVNSDWNASSGVAQILNKPTIPTVPSNIVTGTSSSYIIWVGSQAQYEAIATKDATTIYLITGS